MDPKSYPRFGSKLIVSLISDACSYLATSHELRTVIETRHHFLRNIQSKPQWLAAMRNAIARSTTRKSLRAPSIIDKAIFAAPTYFPMTSKFRPRDYVHDHLQSVAIFDPGLATPHFQHLTHATFGTSVSAKLSLQFNHSGTAGRASDLRIARHKSTQMTR